MKELMSVYGMRMLKSTAVKKWVGRFWSERESVGDDTQAGRLAAACNTCNMEKVKREIKKDHRKMIRNVADSINILRTSVHKILWQNLKMKNVCSKLVLKVLMLEQKKERVFIAETFLNDCEADLLLLGWTRVRSHGFLNMIHSQSVRQCSGRGATNHSTKSSHGLVPAEVDVNFILWCPRLDDGGIGAILGKCRHCFLFQNILETENLYPKEEARVVCGEPVCAPPWQRLQPPSWFNTKVLGEQYVANASSSIFPGFSALQFFYFPKVEIGAEGATRGGGWNE